MTSTKTKPTEMERIDDLPLVGDNIMEASFSESAYDTSPAEPHRKPFFPTAFARLLHHNAIAMLDVRFIHVIQLPSSFPSEQVSPPQIRTDGDLLATTTRKTNFKNCIHVIQRNLEELVLLQHHLLAAVQRTFRAVVSHYQRMRPGRSFPRRSLRPDSKWRPHKEENKAGKPAASMAPA